jgi:hypothetical protein
VALSPPWAPVDAEPPPRPRPAEAPRLACVRFWTEARFAGVAYNHIVHVANGCSAPVSCAVTTSVNPEPQSVTVPSASKAEVVTFIGSPASTFTADVQCVRTPAAPTT